MLLRSTASTDPQALKGAGREIRKFFGIRKCVSRAVSSFGGPRKPLRVPRAHPHTSWRTCKLHHRNPVCQERAPVGLCQPCLCVSLFLTGLGFMHTIPSNVNIFFHFSFLDFSSHLWTPNFHRNATLAVQTQKKVVQKRVPPIRPGHPCII